MNTDSLFLPLLALVLSGLGTWGLIGVLTRRAMLDHPNERSSHALPRPRGGGLAVVPSVLVVWGLGFMVSGPVVPPFLPVLSLAGLGLLLVGWWDDRHNLPAGPRFLAYTLAVLAALAFLPPEMMVFGGLLPWGLDRLLTVLAWLWFLNLYNFMDGIDGITGVETAALGGGIALVCLVNGGPDSLILPGLSIAAAALGFLLWNWAPARIFLGDAGSVPLGFLLGGLLILLACNGQVLAAFVLPAYYVTDASVTLIARALRREKVWQAHRCHFYQQAAAIQGHAKVSTLVAIGNGGLVIAAVWGGGLGLGLAVLVVVAMMVVLYRWRAPIRGENG